MTSLDNTLREEENKFLETVIQDPDKKDLRGGIPDLIDGYSFTRTQTISTQIDASGTGLTGNYDVWIVDWDNESTQPLLAHYRDRNPNNIANAENTYDASPESALDVGGLVAYIMAPGTSPFPSNDPSIVGPTVPLKTISLKFDASVLSGNTRVVGKDFEVKYTAPEISAQGLWTQSSYSTYEQTALSYLYEPAGPSSGTIVQKFYGPIKGCPPGTTSNIVKFPNTVQRPAFDGVLQAAVMNYFDNVPHLPQNFEKVYKSSVKPTGATQYQDLVLCNQDLLTFNNISGDPATWYGLPASFNPQFWKSNSEIHFAVCTGLANTATMQMWRTMTVESYPDPTDVLITFAKPGPLVNMQSLEVAMNAVRSSQQFWAAGDNDFGSFAKGLKGAFQKFKKVGMTGLRVAAAVNPAGGAASALMKANAAKDQMKTVSNAAKPKGSVQKESVTVAKTQRQRTKPIGKKQQAMPTQGGKLANMKKK